MMEERIAHIAADLWKKKISPQMLHLLKRNLADSYAGICASLLDKQMIVTLRKYTSMVPDESGIVVWGTRRRAQPTQAVFMNTILGRRSDLVNTYLSPDRMGGNHPSDNVSLLLTLADWKKLNGETLIRAMYPAYIISCAFSDYLNPEAGGYDHDTASSLYTALIAGLLEGLDAKGLVEAQRIVGAMGMNPDQTGVGLVTDWKHCTYASCAMRGVAAAQMAKAGFKGPVDIYGGQAGWQRFMPHARNFMDPPPNLGRIVFKRWQALVFCQTAIDAAAELSPQFLDHDWRQVEGIRVDTYGKALDEAGGKGCRHPGSRAGRTHSLPYCVLAALIGAGVDYESFADKTADDERITGLMDRVVLQADGEMTAAFPAQAPCRITVVYADRSPLCAFRTHPRGAPEDPLSDEEINDKVAGHLSRLIPLEKSLSLIRRLWTIEQETDLAWLLAPLKRGVTNV